MTNLTNDIFDSFHDQTAVIVVKTTAVVSAIAPIGKDELESIIWMNLSVDSWIRIGGFVLVIVMILEKLGAFRLIKYLFNIAKDYIKGLK